MMATPTPCRTSPEPPEPDDDEDDLPPEDVTGVVEPLDDEEVETEPAHISLEQVRAGRALAHWVARMLVALDVGKVSPALRDEGRDALGQALRAGLTDA